MLVKSHIGFVRRMRMNFKDLKELVLSWADDKDLLHSENAEKQFMKFIEEVFEFKSELDYFIKAKEILDLNNDNSYEKEKYKLISERMILEYGDILVTLIILAKQLDIDPVICLQLAYEKIKDRKGQTINGQFVKEEDL